jgi:hypothetical protein
VQILSWVGAAFVVMILIGVAVGPAEDEKSASTTRSSTGGSGLLDSAGAAAQPTTAAAPAPAPEPTPEDVDTGRMSDGEFELSSRAVDQANEEILAYGDALGGECAALFSALEAAAAIKCVKDGYDGVEGDLAGVVAQMESVRGDVAKQCRRSVDRLYKVANIPLFRALRESRDAFVSINPTAARRASSKLTSEISRWTLLVREFRVECAPG